VDAGRRWLGVRVGDRWRTERFIQRHRAVRLTNPGEGDAFTHTPLPFSQSWQPFSGPTVLVGQVKIPLIARPGLHPTMTGPCSSPFFPEGEEITQLVRPRHRGRGSWIAKLGAK
jgi:hypothetical protein